VHAAVNLGAAAVLAGCAGPLSTLDPSGPAASVIARLWWVMLAGSGALFVLVMGLFAAGYLRPGWGASVSPHRWIVLGGLGLSAVVLVPLVAYGLVAGERRSKHGLPDAALALKPERLAGNANSNISRGE